MTSSVTVMLSSLSLRPRTLFFQGHVQSRLRGPCLCPSQMLRSSMLCPLLVPGISRGNWGVLNTCHPARHCADKQGRARRIVLCRPCGVRGSSGLGTRKACSVALVLSLAVFCQSAARTDFCFPCRGHPSTEVLDLRRTGRGGAAGQNPGGRKSWAEVRLWLRV